MPAKIVKQRYVAEVPVEELKLDPKNAKKHAKQTITDSIRANDFYGAVLAQEKTGLVLAGHGRLFGAKRTGLPSVPVIYVDVDARAARRILAVDNKSAEGEGYDDAKLAALLQEILDDGGLFGTGYTESDLDALVDGVIQEAGEAEISAPVLHGLEYKILIDCTNESDQAEALAKLEADGFKCRPVIA